MKAPHPVLQKSKQVNILHIPHPKPSMKWAILNSSNKVSELPQSPAKVFRISGFQVFSKIKVNVKGERKLLVIVIFNITLLGVKFHFTKLIKTTEYLNTRIPYRHPEPIAFTFPTHALHDSKNRLQKEKIPEKTCPKT